MATIVLLGCERDGGAWPPLAVLSQELSQRGHTVHTLCDTPIEYAFESTKILRIPNPFESTAYLDNIFATDFAQHMKGGEALESFQNPLVTWAEALAPAVVSEVRKAGPDLLVGSMFCLPLAVELGQKLGPPVVSLNPGPYVGPNPPRSFADDYPGVALWWFEHCVLPPILQSDHVLHATDQVFDLGFDGLPYNHYYIGPLIWTPPGSAPSEMAEPGPPWITASVSMVNQPGEMDLVAAILEAADGLPARILVTAPDHDVSTLTSIPPNVLLTKFVSHAAALEQSRVLLSHAGHGAVMRALWMGVPMVLTPWDRDQLAVAHRAEKLGVARVIDREELDAEILQRELASALDDVALHDASQSHHERLQQTNPPALAAELVEEFIAQ